MAEAEQEKLRKEGAGRAAAVEAEGRAEAAKIEAIGLAQAKAIEAQGVAEAAAILRKAEAWKEFNDAARLQTILEKLPAILEASTGIFGAVAAPLGNIDKLVVIDQGNGSADGGSGASGASRRRVRRSCSTSCSSSRRSASTCRPCCSSSGCRRRRHVPRTDTRVRSPIRLRHRRRAK